MLVFTLGSLLFSHFVSVEYQENEPSTIAELTFGIDQFFAFTRGNGPTADISPLYYVVANSLSHFGLNYKELRIISFTAHALSVLALIFLLQPYISMAVQTLLLLLLLLNPLLLFYATQLRFWSLSTFFIVGSICLLLALERGRVRVEIRPLIWLFAFLSCATTLTSYAYFMVLVFIDGRNAIRDRKSRSWTMLIAFATIAMLLVKMIPAYQHRFVHRAILRPELFVFNLGYLTTMFSMYAMEFASYGSALILILVALATQRARRKSVFSQTLRSLIWGAAATQVFFLICASLPAKEIASRYAMWTIFVFFACVPDILNSIQKPVGRMLFHGLLGSILIWEIASTAWFIQHQESMFQPWESTSHEILSQKNALTGVCLYPKFIVDFLRYSSATQDWSQWDNLVLPNCPSETAQNYTIKLYWKVGTKMPPDRTLIRRGSTLLIVNDAGVPGK